MVHMLLMMIGTKDMWHLEFARGVSAEISERI